MQVQIRRYRSSDMDAMARLFDDFEDHLKAMDQFGLLTRPQGYGKRYLTRTLKSISNGKGTMFLATEKDRILGFVVAVVLGKSKDPGAKAEARARIQELCVEKSSRSNGLGAVLMKKAEDYLKKRKCTVVFITVFVPNTRAHDFYRKMGYKDCDVDVVKRL